LQQQIAHDCCTPTDKSSGTDGRMLRGVQFGREVIETETVVMRSINGTIRWIRAEHRQLDKFR
jgi:fructose-1,6-bisphosphatase/sedoheptulose 1,7-bisphosphatase-like protein